MSSAVVYTQTTTDPGPTRVIPIPLLAEFNYYLPPTNGPSAPSTNDLELILGAKDQDARKLNVHDLRNGSGEIDLATSLDEAGFTYISRRDWVAVQSAMTDEEIEGSGYYGQLEDVVRSLYPSPANMSIHHLGHILRGAPRRTDFSIDKPTSQPTDPAWNKPNRHAAPAPRVHIDFTRAGIEMVMSQAFGTACDSPYHIVKDRAASTAGQRRILAFSLWRPLARIRRDPMAMCDARSVQASELIKLPRIYPDGAKGENVVVKASSEAGGKCQHKWFWMSDQTVEEMLVIKIYDSALGCDEWEMNAETGKVGCAPHCSFHLHGTELEGIRESIENRVVVVIEE